jgi:hypothetical protein
MAGRRRKFHELVFGGALLISAASLTPSSTSPCGIAPGPWGARAGALHGPGAGSVQWVLEGTEGAKCRRSRAGAFSVLRGVWIASPQRASTPERKF